MDLDELIRSELTAQAARAADPTAVLAGVADRRGARRRRRRTVTAGIAVIAAVAVPYGLVRASDSFRLGTSTAAGTAGTATPAVLSDAELVRDCMERAPAGPGEGQLLVRLTDRRGVVAWIGVGRWDIPACAFAPAGRPSGTPGAAKGPQPARGYLPAGSPAQVDYAQYGVSGRPGAGENTATAAGRVPPGARRVVVRWSGLPPATVTPTGPYWLARSWGVIEAPGDPVATAYDAAGKPMT